MTQQELSTLNATYHKLSEEISTRLQRLSTMDLTSTNSNSYKIQNYARAMERATGAMRRWIQSYDRDFPQTQSGTPGSNDSGSGMICLSLMFYITYNIFTFVFILTNNP